MLQEWIGEKLGVEWKESLSQVMLRVDKLAKRERMCRSEVARELGVHETSYYRWRDGLEDIPTAARRRLLRWAGHVEAEYESRAKKIEEWAKRGLLVPWVGCSEVGSIQNAMENGRIAKNV